MLRTVEQDVTNKCILVCKQSVRCTWQVLKTLAFSRRILQSTVTLNFMKIRP